LRLAAAFFAGFFFAAFFGAAFTTFFFFLLAATTFFFFAGFFFAFDFDFFAMIDLPIATRPNSAPLDTPAALADKAPR
jgi:hypothetical protein